MSEILVIGHRNPDTDSICSAIGYAEFKRRTGMPEAVAARCGDTNGRIDFVLNTFGLPAPRFVADVSPKVRDVMGGDPVSVPPDATVAEALAIMDENNIRVLPVLDEKRHCRGLASVFKMNQFYLPSSLRLFDSRRVLASLDAIARTVNARIVHGVEPGREDDLVMMIGAMALDSFQARLKKFPPERLIIVVGDRLDIQKLAVDSRVRCLVVTGGLQVDRTITENAQRNGVSLLVSMHDTATTAMLIRAAIAVRHMLDEQFLSFGADEPLSAVRARAVQSEFQAFPVTADGGEIVGVLSKSDFVKKVDRRLILVDHNELTQAVQGAEEVDIIEIIDHHRIGALTTRQPILFRNEPVGSTSTIVAECFLRTRVELPPAIAGLLLAGLITDTLNLTSPTTTSRDAEVLRELEKISGVDATAFTEKVFSSGSVLTSRPPEQAIVVDCKEYTEQGRRFSVAQIEEIGFEQFWKRKADVLSALEGHRRRQGYAFAALLVTDIASQSSLLLLAAPPDILGIVDYPEVEPGIYEMAGVVSRKKQLMPYLAHCLAKLG